MAAEHHVEMPIVEAVHDVLFQDLDRIATFKLNVMLYQYTRSEYPHEQQSRLTAFR